MLISGPKSCALARSFLKDSGADIMLKCHILPPTVRKGARIPYSPTDGVGAALVGTNGDAYAGTLSLSRLLVGASYL